MKEKIKFIDIVLENCEVFTFDAKDVNLTLEGLGRSYHNGYKFNTVKDAMIIINKSATASGGWDNKDWKERISKDITQIWVYYSDVDCVGYHLDWDIEKNEYKNTYEKDKDLGNVMCYIVSKKKKSIKDF